MALRTLGTAATTTLKCLVWQPGGMSAIDAAALGALMKDDESPGNNNPTQNGNSCGWFDAGVAQLYVPNRGYLTLLPGDIVAVDTQTGFPFVISPEAAAAAGWVLT